MNYNNVSLFALGMLGILLHAFFNINKLKKTKLPDGKMYDFKISEYFKLEWASMATSVCLLFICMMVKSEIKQLEAAGNWLGVGFASIGFMTQSIITSAVSGVQNKLGVKDDPTA